MLNDKPNAKLMVQLKLVAKHADEFGSALRTTNIPDPNFPKDELVEHITSLKELPQGIARGVLDTIPPIHDRLTDMKLDFLETIDEAFDPDNYDSEAAPKLQRGNNLDRAIDQLLGSMSTALTLARRQAGKEPPEATPEVQINIRENRHVSGLQSALEAVVINLEKDSEAVEEILNKAKIAKTDEIRERLKRTLQYGQTTARVTKTELGFKQVAKSRLAKLNSALKQTPKLIKGAAKAAAKAIETGARITLELLKAYNKWQSKISEGALEALIEASEGVQNVIDRTSEPNNEKILPLSLIHI